MEGAASNYCMLRYCNGLGPLTHATMTG